MLAFARRHLPLLLATVAVLLIIGCGGQETTRTMGNVLPADTTAWLHLADLTALEGALDSYGLMDVLVEELDRPRSREDLLAATGLVLAEDPRETIHALLQDLVRADVSVHAPLREGAEDPVLAVHLECVDEAAAGRVLGLVSEHADGEIELAGHTALRMVLEDDMTLLIGQYGTHVMMCNEGERWGGIMGAIIDPPPTALVDAAAYQKVANPDPGQISVYVTPGFQEEMRGLPMPRPGLDPAAMGPLMEKYGSHYGHVTADYLLSRITVRQMLTPDSPLEPLLVCTDGPSELRDWLPASTFLYDGWLVENGRAKMQLILELLTDTIETMSAVAGDQMPDTPEDPVAAAEGMLGFSLLDLAERVREVALVGTGDAGWLVMLRGHDETQAQEIHDMLAGIPMLGMLGPGEEVAVGETNLLAWGSPGGGDKRMLMGRHADTMLLAFEVPGIPAMEAFLGQAGQGGFGGAVPPHAKGLLTHDGAGWGYLDVAGLLAAVGEDPAETFDDMPPALARRLGELKLAVHLTMLGDGLTETVMEAGTP